MDKIKSSPTALHTHSYTTTLTLGTELWACWGLSSDRNPITMDNSYICLNGWIETKFDYNIGVYSKKHDLFEGLFENAQQQWCSTQLLYFQLVIVVFLLSMQNELVYLWSSWFRQNDWENLEELAVESRHLCQRYVEVACKPSQARKKGMAVVLFSQIVELRCTKMGELYMIHIIQFCRWFLI